MKRNCVLLVGLGTRARSRLSLCYSSPETQLQKFKRTLYSSLVHSNLTLTSFEQDSNPVFFFFFQLNTHFHMVSHPPALLRSGRQWQLFRVYSSVCSKKHTLGTDKIQRQSLKCPYCRFCFPSADSLASQLLMDVSQRLGHSCSSNQQDGHILIPLLRPPQKSLI